MTKTVKLKLSIDRTRKFEIFLSEKIGCGMSNAQLKRCIQYKVERNTTSAESSESTIQHNFTILTNTIKKMMAEMKEIQKSVETLQSSVNDLQTNKERIDSLLTRTQACEEAINTINDVLENHKKAIDTLSVNTIEI